VTFFVPPHARTGQYVSCPGSFGWRSLRVVVSVLQRFRCNESKWLDVKPEHHILPEHNRHSPADHERHASTGTELGGYLFSNAVSGRLMDGRPFVVRHDPVRRLCLTIGDAHFGCADGAPVIPTPRFSVEAEGSALAYGYLPDNATAVAAVLGDGRRVDDDILSNSAPACGPCRSLGQ
jgi:hypothetical protein